MFNTNRKMQFRTIIRYYSTPIRMAKIFKEWQYQLLVRTKSNNHSPTLLMRMQNGMTVTMLENNVSVFINAITYLTYDPIISVLGTYSREMEIHSKKCSETCSVTHIDTIFIIAVKQLQCLWMDESISKLWKCIPRNTIQP